MTTELVNATPQHPDDIREQVNAHANPPPAEAGNFSLVRGTFSAEEAREVLLNLIEDKITFHRRYLWSRRERFGEENDPAREQRIEELLATKGRIREAIDRAARAGQSLEVHCDIQLPPLAD